MTISLNETVRQDIEQAIRSDDTNKIENLIDNSNVNYVSVDSWGWLHYAAKFGSLEAVKFLAKFKGCSTTGTIGKCDIKNNDDNRPIHIAADYGHRDIVKFFLDNGVEADRKGKDNWTPLHYAANKGYLDIIKTLVEKKQQESFINSKTTDQSTPLHYAAANGYLSVVEFLVEFLIEKGAKIDIKNSGKRTPLYLASEGKHEEVVKLLKNELLIAAVKEGRRDVVETQLSNDANINYVRRKDGWTPLHYAVSKGDSSEDLEFIKFLIGKEADVNAKNSDGNKPLHIASGYGYNKTVNFFLDEQGLNVNDQGADNWTPLHYAADKNYLELGKALMKKAGININARDGSKNQTPLHHAASKGYKEFVKLLIKEGADINAENFNSTIPLDLAANDQDIEEILLGEALINAVKKNNIIEVNKYVNRTEININYSRDDDKWAPLHYAAKLGYQRPAETLVTKDPSIVNAKGPDDNTSMHIAATYGKENIVKFLLDKHGNIDEKNKDDFTPLHCAADKGHFGVAKLLVERGAKIDEISSGNKLPLQLAKDNNHQKIVKLLLNKLLLNAVDKGDIGEVEKYLNESAEVNHLDRNGWTPLHHAANKTPEALALTRLLVRKEADINATAYCGDKPLHVASSHAHQNIVRFFIDEKELDVNDRGSDNLTPLHYAISKGSKAFVEFLIKKEADIYAENSNSTTPLDLAKSGDNEEVKGILLGKALIDAVRENKIRKVREHIHGEANVDYWYEDNKWTPLHYAASLGYQRSAEALISNNATIIDAKDSDGSNPLHIAVTYGRKNIVEFFLEEPREGLIECKGKNDWTPLHYAAYEGHLPVVDCLIEKGADVSAESSAKRTPLQLAVERGDSHKETAKLLRSRALFNTVKQEGLKDEIDEVKVFFTNDVNVNYSNSSNWTPLHNAALNGYLEITKFLVEKGADVDVKTDDRDKPLHIAAKNRHMDIVKFFLGERRLDVNDPGKDNWTPLHYATANNGFDIVQYLVEKREANIDAKSSNNTTPLNLTKNGSSEEIKIKRILLGKALVDAVRQNIISKVIEYIDKGADVNYSYEESLWKPLHYAASLGYQSSAKELIKSDLIDINAKDSDSNEPVHIAAARGHKNIVELLFGNEKGLSSINHKGKSDWTPLHYAAEGGHLPVIELLIEKEADASLKNSDGKIPLQLTREKGHQAIVQLLLNKGLFNAVKVIGAVKEGDREKVTGYLNDGVNINHSDQDGWSLLHHAANREEDDLKFIRFLVEEKGANVNATAHSRDKPLHIASSRAYKDIVEFFLNNNGQDVNDRGKDNWTPLHHAVNKGSSDLVKFLIEREADIYAESSNNITPLELAEQLAHGENNRQEVKAILQGKALIDAIRQNDVSKVRKYIHNLNYSYEKNGWQPLHYAASLGYQTLATELINKDSNIVNAKNSDENTPLHVAAAYGKENIISLLLDKKANINEVGKNNWTPLHYAAYENQLPVVRFLIEKGANIDATGLSNETPLQLAAERGDSHKEVAKLLRSRALFNTLQETNLDDEHNKVKDFFSNEVNVNYSNSSNWTPLHNAAFNGYLKTIEFVVEKGADINARTDDREKPLHVAAKRGHKRVVEFFIDEKELSINEQGKDKCTPLHYAAINNHLNVVQYLIEEKKANIDGQDKDNWTALHHASKEGYIEIVKFLIKKGANINAQNSEGRIPVDLANEPEIIQFLLNEALFDAVKQNKVLGVTNYLNKKVNGTRAEVNYRDQNNGTSLHHAARHGYFNIAEPLVQNGANVNATDLDKWTPLHCASEGGHLGVVTFLTEEWADVNAKNSDGDKPLHIAAKNGHQPIVRFFINDKNLNVDVNDPGKDNWTPLHYAVAQNHSQVVSYLVGEADANITIQNAQGKVPLELASGNQEIVRSLQNKALFDAVEQGEYTKVQKYLDDGADHSSLSENNWTLLHRAAEKGNSSIITLLIEKGANIDAKNLGGNKPLHIAAQYGHINAVKLLLNGKANDKGKDNGTPLYYAAKNNHFEIVRYLVEEKGANMNLKDADDNKPLHLAAKNGHVDIVKFFLDKKLSVNDLGKDSWTPLHYAAEQGKSEIVELLIARGANIDARNSDGKTPLQLAQHQNVKELLLNKALFDAIKRGDSNSIQDSLGSGARVNSTNEWGWGLLHAASVRDNLPLIRSLVESQGADINAKTKDGEKPLHIAAEKGYLEVIRYFLSREKNVEGVNVKELNINDQGKNNWTPLHYAAKYNHPEIVEFLIENGADVNAVSFDRKTPLQLATEERIKELLQNKALFHAVKQGNNNDVKRYLDNGANVNYSDKNRSTVLHEAASRGHLGIVEILISKGADVNVRDLNGNKPLHVAADYGRRNVVEFLLKEARTGLSVNDVNRNGWTPLHYAASRDGLAIVELLVAKRTNINAQDSSGNKPLHIAADNGHRSIIEFFLREYGDELSINDKGHNDWTMLHYAADKGYPEVVKFLIEKGADIDAKNSENKTPLQLASNKSHQEASRLLRNKALFNAVKQGDRSKVEQYLAEGADPNYKDENDWTPLHDAASKGYIEIVKLLKEKEANVDAKSYDAKPLHYAARNGHKNVVEFLIREENVNDRGRNNWTPLHYAARYGRLAVVEFLMEKGANISLKDGNKVDGNKPFHIAAQYGHTNVVEFFLKENREGLNIDDKGANGKTALHHAAEKDHRAVVELLIEKEANINIKDSEENTPLQLATEPEVIKLLQNKALFDAVKEKPWNRDKVNEYLSGNGANVNVTNKWGWGMLHIAAADGNLSIIRFLVDHKGADINIENINGESPLHIAAKNGRVDVVEFFLGRGISINSLGKNSWTPLHYAVEGDHLELSRLLIDKRANISSESSDGKTPLQLAEEKGYREVIDLLLNEALFYSAGHNDIQKVKDYLSKGADVNYSGHNNWTPLHYAAYGNHLKLIKFLVEEGANINAGSGYIRPLHIAAQYGHKDVVEFFLNNDASVNDAGWNSWTPLHYAADAGYSEVVKLLIEMEVDINAQDYNGKTPLQLATEKRHLTVMKTLSNAGLFNAISQKDLRKVEHYFNIGADINSRDSNDLTPLHKAAQGGDLEIVRFLLRKKAYTSAKDSKDYLTSLHEAAKGGNLEVVKLLINFGSNIYDQTRNGAKPLHIAAEYGHKDIVEFFLNRRLNINDPDKNRWTPLHYAAKGGNLEVIQFLVNNKGANINAQDSNNLKPLHIAAEYGHKEIVEFFIVEKQLSISNKDKSNRTLLHYAAESGNLNAIEFLTGKGVNASVLDVNGINPLHIAAEYGHKGAAQFFLDKGLNINYPDKDNRIPLHYAAKGGNLEVIKLLVSKGANINAKDSSDAKPLHIAAEYGHKDIVEFFVVQKQLSVNDQGKDNWTPLYYAVKGKDGLTHKYADENKLLEVIKFLFHQDRNVISARDFYGAKPLHIAAKYGHESVVEFFIQKGLNINDTDDQLLTPLHYAALYGHLKVVKLLVEEGADIRAVNVHGKKPIHSAASSAHKNVVLFFVQQGLSIQGLSINDPDTHRMWTPLHYAAHSGNLDFVQSLLANGANFNATDAHGAKPLHIAAEHGYQRVIGLFIDQGMSVNDQGMDNWTPLHYAAKHGHLNTARFLVEEKDADINAIDSNGKKPLHIAAEYGHKDIVKLFLDNGVSVNVLGANNWTPLHYAASNGHLETVKFLREEKGADINLLSVDHEKPLDIAITTGNERVAEYLEQEQERGGRSRNKRSAINQPQSSAAARTPSLINDLFSWVKSSIGASLNSQAALPIGSEKTSSSTANDLPKISQVDAQIDVNGTIMLLDLLIRKVIGQKHIPLAGESISLLEAQGYASSITLGFDTLLKRTARSCGIQNANFNPMVVQSAIVKQIRSGNLSKMPETLYLSAKEACPEFKQTSKFLACLKDNLEETLTEKLLLHNKQSSLLDDVPLSKIVEKVVPVAKPHKESGPSTMLNGTSISKGIGNILGL